ncbi:MAG: thioredoxin domain-containing protein [Fretibacterium sp.]|nr:thioredoxin domain-containing protein [Fretibacterium sp.]
MNRLKDSNSPYLLRHASNPVDWLPWNSEAFEWARSVNKPIFLSIGYSSCHWCHVMERECFKDPEVAEMLNDTCISIKVDREERPDIDALFMDICRIQNGSGGWPLSLFLTPDGLPFFAATWLPKRTIGRLPGMTDILPRVKWLWNIQNEDVLRGARELADTLKAHMNFFQGGYLGNMPIRDGLKDLRDTFDSQWGGFGFAPKFPAVPRLLFLLEQSTSSLHSSDERDEAFSMVDLTLRSLWRGGIHDQLGGGFARYAVDERWIVPHFEKVLADQAMVLLAAAAAHELRPDEFYRTLAEDAANCALRDFLSPNSCFYTALDADSEDGEGAYYLWQEEELRDLLPTGTSGLFCAAYAVMPGGNFGHRMTGMSTGRNVLYEAATPTELARRYGIRLPEVKEKLAEARRVLLEARSRRTPPTLDDKVLMDWNGLMIGALARASRVFEHPDWRLAAEKAMLFLQRTLPDPKGNWRRSYRKGLSGVPALAGDYAAFLWAAMELHDAAEGQGRKQQKDWLRFAETMAEKLVQEFHDEEHGGFFLSPADDPNLFIRLKSAFDSSVPSANALAVLGLTSLGVALGERKYLDLARRVLSAFAGSASLHPLGHASLLTAAARLKAARLQPEPRSAEPEKEPESAQPEPEPRPEEPEAQPEQRERSFRTTRTTRTERSERRRRRRP